MSKHAATSSPDAVRPSQKTPIYPQGGKHRAGAGKHRTPVRALVVLDGKP